MASIRKLTDGRWQAQFRPIPGGKQVTRTSRRKADAQRWLDEQQALIVTGHFVDPKAGKITFGAYYKLWSSRQIWAIGTKRSMDNTARRVTFWEIPLQLIQRSHIEDWVKYLTTEPRGRQERYGQPLAASTVKAHFARARTIFRAAVVDKRIASDPTFGVKIPRVPRPADTVVIPTLSQVRQLLDAATPQLRVFLALCAFAGLRRGEAMGLQVQDIDFEKQTLSVVRQVQYSDNFKFEVRRPKAASERKVNLPRQLIAMIRAHLDNLGRALVPDSWLFDGRNGGPFHKNTVDIQWRAAKLKASVDGFRIHDLRHFYASGLIAAGCDVIVVQRALGHANATMTLGTYAHLWPNSDDRIKDASAAMFSNVFQSSDELLTNAT